MARLRRERVYLLLPVVGLCYILLLSTLRIDENGNHLETISSNQRDNQQILSQKPNRARTAVIVYIPRNINFVNQFITMLYGSWKYLTKHHFTNYKILHFLQTELNTVDLLVFSHVRVLKILPNDCRDFRINYEDPRLNPLPGVPKCWKIQQNRETHSEYKSLNSYIMFLRSDIYRILSSYTYILRTDMDVFLTPKFFKYCPTLKVVTGIGAYCSDFNRGRLKEISHKLGLTHQGIHCVGSSWYGRTHDIIELSKQAYNISFYLYHHEFRNGLEGLEKFDFQRDPNGRWPDWYRLTSTMYGAEIALNHGVKDFSMKNLEKFDISACNPWRIKESYHLHAYHTECEFNKKRFLNAITEISVGTSPRRQMLMAKLKRFRTMTIKDLEQMNATAYSTFVAWRSAANYVQFDGKWGL